MQKATPLSSWMLVGPLGAALLAACSGSGVMHGTGGGGATSAASGSTDTATGSQSSTASTGSGTTAMAKSCQQILTAQPGAPSGVYTLEGPQGPYQTWCEMVEDGGGWTLALKIDGAHATFDYDDPLWTNDSTLNAGSPDLNDLVTAKLQAYEAIELTDIRLGMRASPQESPQWLVVHPESSGKSLLSLVIGGSTKTHGGVAGWQALLPGATIDGSFCGTDEGLDMPEMASTTRVRIGIVTRGGCLSLYSGIGYGLVSPDTNLACGGIHKGSSDVVAFGYVMVR